MNAATAPVTAYLALGANRGDRLANLRAACAHLAATPGIEIVALSRVYETESVEDGGEGDFLNAALRVRTTLSPEALLAAAQAVEAALGRERPPRHGPRTIDIDILLYREATMTTPRLTIPHPRLPYRAFVLRPLADVLEGGWVRPLEGVSLADSRL